MRLDFFLPFLRMRRKETPRRRGLPIRMARWILPKALFSDPQKRYRGLIRRMMEWTGPAFTSAPIRRGIQAVCLILFLFFFFYVCWPYSVRPDLDASLQEVYAKKGPETIIKEFEREPAWDGKTLRRIAEAEGVSPEEVLQEIYAEGGASVWPSHYTDDLTVKERWIGTDIFLAIDPLVPISTAIAARTWIWSLAFSGGILFLCVLFPRGFCGYLCPLGTLIDCFDWAIGQRVKLFRVQKDGWWVNLKYYLLAGILLSSLFGILLSGIFAAIPVLTRGLLFIVAPLQMGFMRGWHQVPALNAGHYLSIFLFLAVLGLGLMRKRFWCRYVCPSGVVFSIFNVFRVSERKVDSTCINCNKCIEICPFDAIKADFTTRTADCTLCQTCGGVCPTHAIKFVERWNVVDLKVENDPPVSEVPLTRRGFLVGTAAGVGAALGVGTVFGAGLDDKSRTLPVRPPGSVPEKEFLQMCIRCGECFKACPNNVLQPMGFGQGFEGLWTPEVVASWSGCESSCNNCGQVCPTGAIRAISLEEKRNTRMALAIVNLSTCLPFVGAALDSSDKKYECQYCVDECVAAGYNAIEFMRVGTKVDEEGNPIEDSGYVAPVVLPELCVGCGLCQTRCYAMNVKKDDGLLHDTAILIKVGQDLLFHVSRAKYQRDLETGVLSEALRNEFTSHDVELSSHIEITAIVPRSGDEGQKWKLDDTYLTYIVQENGAKLEIYRVNNEDRMMTGSYVALRDAERKKRDEQQRRQEKILMEQQGESSGDGYLPDFLK